MDRRSRIKNLTILPTIDEVEYPKKRQRRPWLAPLIISGLSTIAYPYVIHHVFRPPTRQLTSIPKHTVLFDDGTLFATQEFDSACDYLTNHRRNHTAIKQLHFHFDSCLDSPKQIQDHVRAHLLADATKINFSSSCGDMANGSSLIRRLVDNTVNSIHPLIDPRGKMLTSTDLCNATLHHPFLTRDIIQNSFQGAVPKIEAEDVVIQVDPSIPISTYIDVMKRVRLEEHSVKTVLIMGVSAESLATHLSSIYPSLEIEARDNEASIFQLYSRMMYARVAGVCSTLSLCGLAILSNEVGGFVSIDKEPEWVLRNTAWRASNIDFFGEASQSVAVE